MGENQRAQETCKLHTHVMPKSIWHPAISYCIICVVFEATWIDVSDIICDVAHLGQAVAVETSSIILQSLEGTRTLLGPSDGSLYSPVLLERPGIAESALCNNVVLQVGFRDSVHCMSSFVHLDPSAQQFIYKDFACRFHSRISDIYIASYGYLAASLVTVLPPVLDGWTYRDILMLPPAGSLRGHLQRSRDDSGLQCLLRPGSRQQQHAAHPAGLPDCVCAGSVWKLPCFCSWLCLDLRSR